MRLTIVRFITPVPFLAAGLAAAWLVSTVALPLPGAPVLAGAGFVASVVITSATVAAWAVTGWGDLTRAFRAHHAVAGVAALLLAAFIISTAATGAAPPSVIACARTAAIGGFAFVVVCANRAHGLGSAFASAALALLAIYTLLFGLGLAFTALRPYVFLTLVHQHLARVPRFAALTGSPGSTGAWALLAVGLVGPVRRVALRRGARGVGLFIALASFSAATLVLPAIVAAAMIRPLRTRVWTTCALALFALLPLYVHLLTVEVRGHAVTVSALHPSYTESGLGPELMPVHEVGAFGARVRFHFTAYAALVVRAATCLAEHPVVGVGPRRFEDACPIVTMNTYGGWSAHRSPHNQLTELGVELGLVGIVLLGAAVWTLRRRMLWSPSDRWCLAVAVGLVVYSFSAEVLLSLPFAGYFALYLSPRPARSVAT